jgi:predicted TIM-barrel fold metal-dependent hydrolase
MLDMTQFHGRLNDLDSHIQPSPEKYPLAAGEVGRNFVRMLHQMLETLPAHEAKRISSLVGEESQEFTDETVWHLKGSIAPGAFTPTGRLKALDFMGVNRALIFPDPGIQAAAFAAGDLGVATMRHWNDFAVGFSKENPDRLRSTALLNTYDIDIATREAERVIKAGGRAFVMASAVPPGNVSPAHQKMDRLWGLLEAANAPVLLHIGGEQGFMAHETWGKGVEHLDFQPNDMTSESEQVNTYIFSSFHYSPQNFLSTLVLGGVFERFPRLRCGAIEQGAIWLGPMAERLDQVAALFKNRMSGALSMKPSDYIRRNLRITPFRFEPIADYIDRYGYEECYCYSSDFPHPEGGTRPLKEFTENIGRLGQVAAEKFFVTNGEWLLPPLGS